MLLISINSRIQSRKNVVIFDRERYNARALFLIQDHISVNMVLLMLLERNHSLNFVEKNIAGTCLKETLILIVNGILVTCFSFLTLDFLPRCLFCQNFISWKNVLLLSIVSLLWLTSTPAISSAWVPLLSNHVFFCFVIFLIN